MICGTVSARHRKSLQPNLVLDDSQTNQLRKFKAGMIQEMVRVATEATYYTQTRLSVAQLTVPALKTTLQTGLCRFFEQAGVQLCKQMQTHYFRNISELV
ncbi:hypothetical protein EDD11_004218 [Mortierella claussenii]|nr:hypothetical protein EDD11_004218 [Mortierella claussenii]